MCVCVCVRACMFVRVPLTLQLATCFQVRFIITRDNTLGLFVDQFSIGVPTVVTLTAVNGTGTLPPGQLGEATWLMIRT